MTKSQWSMLVVITGTGMRLLQLASTSNGDWSTGAVGNIAKVMDIIYNSSSLSNAPTQAANGTIFPNTSATQPVGTISDDSGSNLIIGNNAVTGGVDGFPGSMAEIILWKATPTAAQIEAIRRNQGAYYGLGAIVN